MPPNAVEPEPVIRLPEPAVMVEFAKFALVITPEFESEPMERPPVRERLEP